MDDPAQPFCTFNSPMPDKSKVGYSALWTWGDKRRVDETGVCDNHALDLRAWAVDPGTEIA